MSFVYSCAEEFKVVCIEVFLSLKLRIGHSHCILKPFLTPKLFAVSYVNMMLVPTPNY